jgi:hypothetical protein
MGGGWAVERERVGIKEPEGRRRDGIGDMGGEAVGDGGDKEERKEEEDEAERKGEEWEVRKEEEEEARGEGGEGGRRALCRIMSSAFKNESIPNKN